MITYFKNLTIELHSLFLKHAKFHANPILLNIWLMTYLLIFDIFEILQVWRIEGEKKSNSVLNLSKFTSNKKKLSGVVVLVYNQVCC